MSERVRTDWKRRKRPLPTKRVTCLHTSHWGYRNNYTQTFRMDSVTPVRLSGHRGGLRRQGIRRTHRRRSHRSRGGGRDGKTSKCPRSDRQRTIIIDMNLKVPKKILFLYITVMFFFVSFFLIGMIWFGRDYPPKKSVWTDVSFYLNEVKEGNVCPYVVEE